MLFVFMFLGCFVYRRNGLKTSISRNTSHRFFCGHYYQISKIVLNNEVFYWCSDLSQIFFAIFCPLCNPSPPGWGARRSTRSLTLTRQIPTPGGGAGMAFFLAESTTFLNDWIAHGEFNLRNPKRLRAEPATAALCPLHPSSLIPRASVGTLLWPWVPYPWGGVAGVHPSRLLGARPQPFSSQ